MSAGRTVTQEPKDDRGPGYDASIVMLHAVDAGATLADRGNHPGALPMRSLFHRIFVILSRLRGGAIDLSNARYERRVAEISRREAELPSLTDEALQLRFAQVRQRLRSGTPFDKLLLDGFAIVREAARRTVGMR